MDYKIDVPDTFNSRQAAVDFFYVAARDYSVMVAKIHADPIGAVTFLGKMAQEAFDALGITEDELETAKRNHPA